MIDFDELRAISNRNENRIILLIMDGLGGLPKPETGKTELETAYTPNLDNLAKQSICGLANPVGPGIIPGSGPGHLALFGYDPLKYKIGRGVLEALGIDFKLGMHDMAARGNFCTVNKEGQVIDRRAGRLSSEKCIELCKLLNSIALGKTELYVRPVKEHRFLLVLRNKSLSADISDTDPQKLGEIPFDAKPKIRQAEPTANLLNIFLKEARNILRDHYPANMVLLRGFSKLPEIPSLSEIYKLNPAAVASYPMYRGLAKLVGMKVLRVPADTGDMVKLLAENYSHYDYFFVHFKETDSAGEDGNFDKKVAAIEKVDTLVPRILELNPDVLVVTADHSTPALLKGHSWHTVPFLMYSRWCRTDTVREFSESACLSGGLGIFPSIHIMPLAMANALKFTKFGA